MKTTSFNDILRKNFSPAEIKEIKEAADLEYEILKGIQNDISKNLSQFMENENCSLSDISRKLGTSLSQVKKILQGKANLTIASMAHIYALMGKKPKWVSN
jgi:hypothetical protein